MGGKGSGRKPVASIERLIFLRNHGKTYSDIARIVGVSRQTIHERLKPKNIAKEMIRRMSTRETYKLINDLKALK